MKAGPLLAPAHLARGAAALSEGRHEDAFESLWPVFDEADESFHRFMRWPAVLDLVEAAVGSGQAKRIDGLSNREIAERLFVSHRTIGSHLYHIFPKLGITARTQLRDALKAVAGQYQSLD